jgi:hypothetical protein
MLSVLPFADEAHRRVDWWTVNRANRSSLRRQPAHANKVALYAVGPANTSAEETVNVTSSQNDTFI